MLLVVCLWLWALDWCLHPMTQKRRGHPDLHIHPPAFDDDADDDLINDYDDHDHDHDYDYDDHDDHDDHDDNDNHIDHDDHDDH